MKERFNQLVIKTPEGIEFVHQLASPVVRLIALSIDVATTTAILSLVSTVATWLQWVSVDLAYAFFALLYFIINIGYFILLEIIWRGQTLGKRMMRLKVIDASGLKLRSSQLVLRNLLRFVDSLPVFYFVGGLCALVSARSQRLGDVAAGTVVIRMSDLSVPKLNDATETYYNSFREHPRLEALLRQRVSPEASAIALQALMRRDEFEAKTRAELFRQIAQSFKEAVAFPPDLIVTMSDEQYVRNCVDTIYRAAS